MIKFFIRDYEEISFININSLQTDTVSYWLTVVHKCNNWR